MRFIRNINTAISKYKQSYGDQMIRTFITSKFAKTKINTLFIMFCTIILRNILCIIFCIAFATGNYYGDFFLHSLISILCLFSSTFIYDGLMGKKERFYQITRYYINNYTPSRYRKWKRNIILPIALSAIFGSYFYEINSADIRYMIWQSLFIYFIMDIIEHNKLQFVSDYLYEKQKKMPKEIVKKEIVVEHGFMTMNKEEYRLKKFNELTKERQRILQEQTFKKSFTKPQQAFQTNFTKPQQAFQTNFTKPEQAFQTNFTKPEQTFKKIFTKPQQAFQTNFTKPEQTFKSFTKLETNSEEEESSDIDTDNEFLESTYENIGEHIK